jgi:hypothetical protein
MGSGSDLLKDVTGKVVTYLTTPAQERKAASKRGGAPLMTQWFGMVPMGVQLWWQERKKEKPHVPEGS